MIKSRGRMHGMEGQGRKRRGGEEGVRESVASLGYSSRLGLLGCWAVTPLYCLKQPPNYSLGLRLKFDRADRKNISDECWQGNYMFEFL